MRWMGFALALIAGASLPPRFCAAQTPAGNLPTGPIAGQPGQWILPNGRRITPAGRQTTLGNFPLGLALTPDGKYLIVVNNGAGPQSLQVIEASSEQITQTLPVHTVFYGVVISRNGKRVWVAGGGAQAVLAFDFANGKLTPAGSVPVFGYPTGLALTPDDRTLLVTCNLTRHITLLDTAKRTEKGRIPTGAFPFAVAIAKDGRNAWVTNWGDGSVSLLDLWKRKSLKTVPTGGLPSAVALSPDGKRAYVANANTDTVTILNAATGARLRDVDVSLSPTHTHGSLPNGLSFSPDGLRLYITLAGRNAVAVYPTNQQGVLTYPTGWYPTGIACAPDGKFLYVVNSKGVGSGPNSDGAYIGHMMNGTLSQIPIAATDTPQSDTNNGTRQPETTAFPLPPINHCVLIVRENRSYDQLLGDRGTGNGDPGLTMYGQKITPNLHALADRFATADNFYSDGEISAQGHQWTLGAYCPDYVEKTWMAYYTPRGRLADSPYAPITYPALGYMIDHCVRNRISCRMYGDAVRIDKTGKPLPELADKYDPKFRGWDLDYPDTQRAAEWLREFQSGIFPAFTYIWLPNDHTAGTRLGSKTPRAMIADNDVATGQIIAAISHSPYWKDTAIFLCEDDSQDGRDHVDAHRNILLVASPWARAGTITSHHYSQASIYATIERLLHLPPMSQFDECADPITDIWVDMPDLRPFDALDAQIPTDEKNTARSAMWRESARLDLDDADSDKTGLLEKILWRDSRPQNSLPHAPRNQTARPKKGRTR